VSVQSKYSESYELQSFEYGVEDIYNRETVLDIPYADLDCIESCHTLEELRITCIDTNGKVYNVKLNKLI